MEKRLTKSRDRMIFGVIAGLAEYFGVETTLARICYVALSILSVCFPGVLLYIIMAIIMPRADQFTGR